VLGLCPVHPCPHDRRLEEVGEKRELDAAVARLEAGVRREALPVLQETLRELETSPDLTPQQRGKLFEEWLGQWFRLYGAMPTLDVRNDGEQIDFTLWVGNLFVIGEARWLKGPVDCPQVRDFFGKLLNRPPFVIGMVISMAGFTHPALEYLRMRSGDRTVLTMTGEERWQTLRGNPELPSWFTQAVRSRLEHP